VPASLKWPVLLPMLRQDPIGRALLPAMRREGRPPCTRSSPRPH
jgi:hypothetical protein